MKKSRVTAVMTAVILSGGFLFAAGSREEIRSGPVPRFRSRIQRVNLEPPVIFRVAMMDDRLFEIILGRAPEPRDKKIREKIAKLLLHSFPGEDQELRISAELKHLVFSSYRFFLVEAVAKENFPAAPELVLAVNPSNKSFAGFQGPGKEPGKILFDSIREVDLKSFNRLLREEKAVVETPPQALDLATFFINVVHHKLKGRFLFGLEGLSPALRAMIGERFREPFCVEFGDRFRVIFFTSLDDRSFFRWEIDVYRTGMIEPLLLEPIQ